MPYLSILVKEETSIKCLNWLKNSQDSENNWGPQIAQSILICWNSSNGQVRLNGSTAQNAEVAYLQNKAEFVTVVAIVQLPSRFSGQTSEHSQTAELAFYLN